MALVIAIVVPSTTMLMIKELQVQFLAILNWQDWTETAHASSFKKMCILGWWQPCCPHISSIF